MRWVAVAIGLLACELAAAATIHRCGADGRTFSQAPCRDGEGAVLPVDAAPSADRLQQARDVATREAAAAARLARYRQQLERQATRGPAVIPHTPNDAAQGGHRTRARARDFQAVSPGASRPAR